MNSNPGFWARLLRMLRPTPASQRPAPASPVENPMHVPGPEGEPESSEETVRKAAEDHGRTTR